MCLLEGPTGQILMENLPSSTTPFPVFLNPGCKSTVYIVGFRRIVCRVLGFRFCHTAKLLDLSKMCSALIWLRRDEVIETASGLQYEAAISSVMPVAK